MQPKVMTFSLYHLLKSGLALSSYRMRDLREFRIPVSDTEELI